MAISTLSKALHPDDYPQLPDEMARFGHARNLLQGLFDPGSHPHRAWEYSIALAALGSREQLRGQRVLEVGCGLSILPALMFWGGADVTANDISDHGGAQEEMVRRMMACPSCTPGGVFRFVQANFAEQAVGGDYDAVVCTSVIEHVEAHKRFFAALISAVGLGGVLVLTTDFSQDGGRKCEGHLRTYSPAMLNEMAKFPGFVSEGGTDYSNPGDFVYNYNFASLVLRRVA
jgi:SAM-dependent methyltransferase